MQTNYPTLPYVATQEDLRNWCETATRLRQEEDLPDFDNLQQVFMSGRKVEKVPTSSSDVAAQDRAGDFNFAANGTYMYVAVNDTGTLKWGRITIATSW